MEQSTVSFNWRYWIGHYLNLLTHAVLSCYLFPLTRLVPKGRVWMYDVQVAYGTRRFDVIFDVGANVGQTAWGLVRYFPSASIHCFEPVEETFQILKNKYGTHPQVTLIKQALGSCVEKMQISLSTDSEQNTLVPGGSSNAPMTETRTMIDVNTLDNYCRSKDIRMIDLLKIDVQGWELEVLKNIETPVRFVYVETGFNSSQKDMQDFSTLHARMEELGFLFGGLYEQFRYGPKKEFVGFGNALYINPNLIPCNESADSNCARLS